MNASTPASITAALSLALFLATVCPTVPFGDGGELIAAADSLGVAHPPGYPLYTFLGWLALQVPLGEPALRMNAMSAFFGALACGAAAWFVHRACGSRIGGLAAGATLALSSTFWSVATVTEVYTLHVLCTAVLLCAALEPSRRAVLVGAVALGLGLGHHPTIVLALPAVLVLSLRHDRRPRAIARRTWVTAAALACALPVLAALALQLRAAAAPASNWGDPSTLGRLWAHVTAAGFRHLDLGFAGMLRADSWRQLGGILRGEFFPLVWPLAALGLFARYGRAGRRVPLALGTLVAAGTAFGLRYVASDREVFYLPAFLGIALVTGLGVAKLESTAARTGRVVATVVALVLVAGSLFARYPQRNLRGFTAAADYATDVLASVPPNGILFVESDSAFPLAYRTQVVGERPDVKIFDRRGFLFDDVLRGSGMERAAGESVRAHRVRVERALLEFVLSREKDRAVLFLGWPGYEPPPPYRSEPFGLLYRIRPDTAEPWPVAELWASYHGDSILRQARRVDDGFARSVAASYSIARGERAFHEGREEEAERELANAAAIAPQEPGVANYVGTVYARRADWPAAIASFRRAVAIQPVRADAWNNLAMACERAGDRACAVAAWRESLAVLPGQAEALQGLERAGETPLRPGG